jgi:hypothetical protein
MLKQWLMDKTFFLLTLFCLIILVNQISFAQNKKSFLTTISNDEVKISLIKLHPFSSSNNKDGHKFLVAEILIENVSDKIINIGSEYSMSMVLIDSNGKEYKSGIKGAGIVSEFLTKDSDIEQDQKAYNLSFSDKFPPKTKAQSFLCGYEVPNNAQIVKFGIKKKNLFSEIQIK